MGFYLRKGINFGPLRLNLSRSGLGASFGVKGARIGIGPKGSYVHMGRGGMYYRQSLAPARGPHYVQSPSEPVPPPNAPDNPLQQFKPSSTSALPINSPLDLF